MAKNTHTLDAARERVRIAIAQHRLADAERELLALARTTEHLYLLCDVLGSLANVTAAQGLTRAADAADRWMRCLDVAERVFDPGDARLGSILASTCAAFERVGEYRALVPLSERNVAAVTKQLGLSAAMITAMVELALVQRFVGSRRPAKVVIAEATSLFESVRLDDERQHAAIVAELVNARGLVALDERDPNAAHMLEDAYRFSARARGDEPTAYRTDAFGRGEPVYALNVAAARLARREWAEAEAWLERAALGFGTTRPGALWLRQAELSLGVGRLDEAERQLDEAEDAFELPAEHPRFAEIELCRASVLRARGQHAASAELAREAIASVGHRVYKTSPFLSRADSLVGV